MPKRPQSNLFEKFRDLRQQYQAGYAANSSSSRFRRHRTGVSSLGASADSHLANEAAYLYGIEYSRAMHRDDVIIKQTTRRAVQQQVQNGFRLDPQTGESGLDEAIWQNVSDWMENAELCDVAGEMEFADMEQAAFEAMLADGDHLALGLQDGRLQMVEAHRCRTPNWSKTNVVLGVQLNSFRRRLGYHLVADTVDPTKRTLKLDEAPFYPTRNDAGVRQVFHVMHADRVSLTRGLTAYHPLIDLASMFDDTNFALVIKQQITACFGIFFEQTGDYGTAPQTGEQTTIVKAGTSWIEEDISPGQKHLLPKGIKPHAYNPTVASQETMAHLRFLLQLIGLNLGLPLVLVLLDASETNFSGWRGALDAARVGFRCNQQHLLRRFHKPVYRWKLHWFMSQDTEFGRDLRRWHDKLGAQLFWHRWHTPTWPYVQPLDDAKADAFCLSNLLKSPRQVAAERGRDFDEIVDETVTDNARAILLAMRAAKRLRRRFPDEDVNWRDLLNRDLYKGGQLIDQAEQRNVQTAEGNTDA